MPNNSYSDASSLAPAIGFKPDGFLGGMWAGQRNQNYQQAVEQTNLMKALEAQDALMKNQTYQLDAPVRESGRLADITKNNTTVTTYPDIQGGLAAQGRTQTATAPGIVAAANAENAGKVDTANLQQHSRAIDLMVNYGPMILDLPPLQGQQTYDTIRQKFPEMQLPPQFEPEKLKTYIDAATKAKKQMAERENAPAIALQELKNQGGLAQTKAAGGFSVQVANIHSAATKAAAAASAGADKVKTFEHGIVQLEKMKHASPEEWKKNPNMELMLQELKGQQAREKIYATLPAVLNSNLMEGKKTDIPALLEGVQKIVDQASGKQEAKTPESQWNEEWAALEPGQTKVGLDGKTYTKRKQ